MNVRAYGGRDLRAVLAGPRRPVPPRACAKLSLALAIALGVGLGYLLRSLKGPR